MEVSGDAFAGISPKELLAMALSEKARRMAENKLARYRPYAKQQAFHAAGAWARERLLRAGNQNGKTFCCGAEVAYHLTGKYPEDWPGLRWDRPVVVWASSETAESTRDNPQRSLLGLVGEVGTGAIPAECLGAYGMASGTADLYDYIKIKHVSGGWSTLRFKYYAQGRRKWQGPPVDFVWFDEEPPEDIYDEGLARTIATAGCVALTFTPLQGMSSVVRRYLINPTEDRSDTNMTIEDAEHIPAEERAKIIASFPAHQRDARSRGIPTLGSGLIFPVAEEVLREMAISIPSHWPRICGLDFGWDHPTAAVWIAWDRDNDTVHIYDCYRVREATPMTHAMAVNARGKWIPVAWPHDGLQHDKGSGDALADQYRKHGVNMLKDRATHPPQKGEPEGSGGNGVEAGLMDMLDRMQTGRFKVAKHLQDWWEEFRLYHREDGKIVKECDDLMSATRYGLMMLRMAVVNKVTAPPRIPVPIPSDSGMGMLGHN